jgi:hypothetical protein
MISVEQWVSFLINFLQILHKTFTDVKFLCVRGNFASVNQPLKFSSSCYA